MANEDEVQALQEENRLLKALVAQLLPLQEPLAQAQTRIKDQEDRLPRLLAALPSVPHQDAERARQRIYLDAAGWSKHEEAGPHLRTIQEAAWQDRGLLLTYRKANGEIIERIVDPLGLVAKAGIWYLVGATQDGMRVLRISRV